MNDYSIYLYAAGIFLAAWGYFLFFARNKGLSPAFLFLPAWGVATALFYFKLKYDLYEFDAAQMINGSGLSLVILPFAIASAVGFILGDLVYKPKEKEFNFDELYQEADATYRVLYFLFYVAVVLAIIRFYVLGGFSGTLADMRSQYVGGASRGELYTWIYRLCSYMIFPTSYLLVTLAICEAHHNLPWWKVFMPIFLYAIPGVLSISRNFLADIFCFFIITVLFYSYRKTHSWKKVLVGHKKIWGLLAIGICFFGILGILRNEDDQEIGSESFATKFFYISDGLGFSDYVIQSEEADNHNLSLEPLFFKSYRDQYAASTEGTSLENFISSILPDLYYVFGKYLAIYWFFFVFLIQLLAVSFRARNSLPSQLIFIILTEMMLQTLGMNSFLFIFQTLCFWLLFSIISRKLCTT